MYTTELTRVVAAPPHAVYQALLDADAIARWRVPAGMSAQVHVFEPWEGGTFRVSLTYVDEDSAGKTSAHTDTYRGCFVRLVTDREVVEELQFETGDPELGGLMRVTTTLREVDGRTEVRIRHEGVPDAVPEIDNEIGTTMALDKLACYVESP